MSELLAYLRARGKWWLAPLLLVLLLLGIILIAADVPVLGPFIYAFF